MSTSPYLSTAESTPTDSQPHQPTQYPRRPRVPQPRAIKSADSTRSIRAQFTDETITVYQAFNSAIATAAVESQSLCASPLYQRDRITWIKPSWAWMLYRSGYSHKDSNQAHILALELSRAGFAAILAQARVAGDDKSRGCVLVQWDPERSVRIGRVDGVRSIQIGIPPALNERFVAEWVVRIRDVTDQARELRRVLDEEPKVGVEVLRQRGLVPVEEVYDRVLCPDIRRRLGMVVGDDEEEEEDESR